MKAKHQRLILALVALGGVAGAGVLAASALRDEAAYFRTPAEVKAGKAEVGEAMRLGGMVAVGSIKRQSDGVTIRFVATDGKAHLRWVAPGARGGDTVEIRAGVEPGERVVLEPADLVEGAPVRDLSTPAGKR